jgi:biotin carboxyl carrier protein/small nuclear ribonucleoprotein (snRNP)-like protein
MIKNTLLSLSLFIISLTLAFLTSCGTNKEKEEEKSASVTPVTCTGIQVQPMLETLELNAVSSFLKKNIVKSTAIGVVETIEINLGDRVEKGQPLFVLKTKEAIAISETGTPDSSLRFRGTVQIKASKTGVITSLTHQKGDYVQDGDELAVISEQSSLVFLLEAPYELHNYLTKSKSVDIQLSNNRIIKGIISSNLAQMNMASQTENFILRPQTTDLLPENLIARIKLVKSSKTNATVLPKSAVLSNETGK